MNNKAITTLIIAIVAFAAGYFLNSAIGGERIQSESQVKLDNQWDSLSYFIGLSIGYQTAEMFDDLQPSLVGSGINTIINDSSKYDAQMAQMIAMQLQQSVFDNKARADAEEGVKFLEENGRRDGVFVTESGLQYEPLSEGDGPMPTDTSVVEVHYHGTFIDGKVFDTTRDDGEPATFGLNQVIKGWTEGIQLMSVGSKYKFYVPSDLAYGPRGRSGIPPNSVLIFEVELLSIVE
jgi:FKBP-type peptidyl-prolyl cis-trans isomerase